MKEFKYSLESNFLKVMRNLSGQLAHDDLAIERCSKYLILFTPSFDPIGAIYHSPLTSIVAAKL